MKKKQIILALIIAIGIAYVPSINANAASGRWVEKENWYYINTDGSIKTGWLLDKGTWYYLKSNGQMVTGWYKVNDLWYYFNNDGSMKTGWLLDGGSWYYLKNSGEMATRWMQVNGTWYYFSDNGSMRSDGWLVVDEKEKEIIDNDSGKTFKYYLNSDGSMKIGWLNYDQKWYYLNSNGQAATRWMYINNKWYYFDDDAEMVTGWNMTGDYTKGNSGYDYDDPKCYYFSKSGEWIEDTNDFYEVEIEKYAYDTSDKEIKFTVTNNSDSDYRMYPLYSLQVIKDGYWRKVEIRHTKFKELETVESGSKKTYTIDVNDLLGGKLETGEYRICQGDGKSYVYAGFRVTCAKEPDVEMKTDDDSIIIDENNHIDYNKEIKYTIKNNSDKEIDFSSKYKIQRLNEDGKWEDVSSNSNYSNKNAIVLSKDTYRSFITLNDLKDAKENIFNGTYRIVKEINGHEVYAEFNAQYEIQY